MMLLETSINYSSAVSPQHLFNFYESCQGDSNSEGIGTACDAIAKIYARFELSLCVWTFFKN